jgi:hypothetical protein
VRATHEMRTPDEPSRARHSVMAVDRTLTDAQHVPPTALSTPACKQRRARCVNEMARCTMRRCTIAEMQESNVFVCTASLDSVK